MPKRFLDIDLGERGHDAMMRPVVYWTDAGAVALLWMARVHDFAGSWALVSDKELHIWAWPLIPVQPWHMGGFDQPHIQHPSWHLQADS